MDLPIKWTKKYVNTDISTRELADRVTLSGSHVESIHRLDDGIEGVVVARVEEILPHPNADKLVITKIKTANEVKTIVTGAPNVKEGARVLLALDGAKLPNGMEIKTSDFRGVMSEGMLCSYGELAYPDSVIPKEYKDGIVLLADDFELGIPAQEALGLDDEVIELEITPNRPDCLSILGMAREVAATIDEDLIYPETSFTPIASLDFKGEVKTDKCSKLSLAVLKDVEIKESPNYIQNLLMKVGIRPINNVVDLTNLVMVETGQPFHAYDLDKLSQGKLVVDEAKDGDRLVSLDGKERKLKDGDLVITDGKKILGLAGLMGGLETEVTKDTKNILIEAASFDPHVIKETSARLQLKSEAQARFEKLVNPKVTDFALSRLLYLAEKIGAGSPYETGVNIKNYPDEEREIKLSISKANKILGTDLSKDQMIDYLKRLEFILEDKGDYLLVSPPAFRTDIEIEEDLIEEVGRIFGFYRIEPKRLVGPMTRGKMSDDKAKGYQVKKDLYGLGYSEVLSYSFVSPSLTERAGLSGDRMGNFIKLRNPLGEEFSVMRTAILPNLIEIMATNYKNKAESLSIFELGSVFTKDQEGNISEKSRLSMASYGQTDFYSFKADFVELMRRRGIEGLSFEPVSDLAIFHPGRASRISLDGKTIAYMGELSYKTRKEFGIDERAYGLEADLDLINREGLEQKRYKKINRFPSIVRDISIITDKATSNDYILAIIRSQDDEILEDFILEDIYSGEQIDDNKKSMTYEIVYRAKDRTLKDKEVNLIQDKIIEALEEKDIHLRG